MRMSKKSVTNPYIILSIIHFCLLGFAFYKKPKERRNLLILLFTNVGFAYFFDYIIFTIFNSYRYHPNILKLKPLDNVLGAIFSQGIFIPFTAVFISALKLGWKAKILFSLYFSSIERLFLTLNIFHNKWWNTIYTFLLVPVAFQISDLWLEKIKTKDQRFLWISLFIMSWVTWLNLNFILTINRKVRYGIGELPSWQNHFKIGTAIGLFVAFITTVWIKKANVISKIKLFFTLIFVNFLLLKMKIIKVTSHKLLLKLYLVYLLVISLFNEIVPENNNEKST